MDIQNTTGAMGPETTDKKIALVITRNGQWGRRGRRGRICRNLCRAAMTGVNEGLIIDSKNMTCKIQFVMQLIVAGKDTTTKRAGKPMVHRELLTTAITVGRKIRRGLGMMEIEGITELLGREFSAMVK